MTELNLGHDDIVNDLDDLTKAQIQHAKDAIQNYERLQGAIRRHEASINEFTGHLFMMLVKFEEIIDAEKFQVSGIVKPIQVEVAAKVSQFKSRIDHVLTDYLKLVKNIQKVFKEKGYLELDLRKYATDNKKLKEKQQLQDKEYKRTFENQRKIEESKEKLDNLNNLLKTELPSFLVLSNQIARCISIIIFFHLHDLYKSMFDSFIVVKKYFPHIDLNNIYFENNARKVKEIQKDICEKLESLQIFNHYSNLYNVMPSEPPPETDLALCLKTVRLGRALYDFEGERSTDLSFYKGDYVTVLEENPSGWWKGRLLKNGLEGSFPFNYFSFQG